MSEEMNNRNEISADQNKDPKNAQNGTTYSWVNPKLQQTDGSQQHSNPWGGAGSSSWNQESAAGQSRGANSGSQQYHYSSVGTAPQAGAGSGGKTKKAKAKKPRKPMSTGRRWAATVAMALVFGVIAGGTMYGVNRAAEYLDGEETVATVPTTQPLLQTDSGSDSSAEAASASSGGTVKEVAANAMPSLVTISTMSVEEMRSFFGGTQQYEVQGAGTGGHRGPE